MQKTSSFYYSLFVIMSLFAAPVIRYCSVFFRNYICAWVYITLVAAAIISIAYESLKTRRYAEAFIFKNPFHLDVFSYIASAGLFFSFITQCVMLYNVLTAEKKSINLIITAVMGAVCALVSSGYFIIVGFSFGDKNYDFREFKLIHIVPMLWALSNVFSLVSLSTGFEKSIDSILKYTAIMVLVCFFYCFALEVDSKGKAKSVTVLFARLYSYLSVLFFTDRLILVMTDNVSLISAENAFALTGVMFCGFIFFFEKNIYNNYLNEKTEL